MISRFFNKLNIRAKVFSCVAIFIIIAIIFDKLFLSSLYQSFKDINYKLSEKNEKLIKYYSVIGKKRLYEKKLEELKVSYNSLEEQFFSSKTEDLALAKLQTFVKNIAKKNGIIVSTSSIARKSEVVTEDPHLILIHTKFEIKDVEKMRKVQSFLYDIEYEAKKHISIDDIKIKESGFGRSKGAYVSITISAIAKIEVNT